MAEVKLKLFANLRETAGTSEIQVSGENVRDVLLSVSEKFPGLKQLIFETGVCETKTGKTKTCEDEAKSPSLCGNINVLINGNNIRHLKGLDTPLSEADEVAVLPPVSGG